LPSVNVTIFSADAVETDAYQFARGERARERGSVWQDDVRF